MLPQVLWFDEYLENASHQTINIKGIRYNPKVSDEPVAVDEDIEYIHRWTKAYDHRILWKLYNLMWHYKLHPDEMPKYTMMITDTGSHASPRHPEKAGLSHMRYLAKFHESHKRQKLMVKRYLGNTKYLSILEGHPESGFVHAHDLYFLDECPTDKTLDALENHWNNTLKMGSQDHGFDPEIKEPKDFKNIESLIAYPMAYVGKSSIGAVLEWSKYDLIFNTCLWMSPRHPLKGGIGTRVRAFQPSRSLSAIMNKSSVESGYTHIETTMRDNRTFDDPRVLNRAEKNYKMNIKAWKTFGGGYDEMPTTAIPQPLL
jgi:hypothetical protein